MKIYTASKMFDRDVSPGRMCIGLWFLLVAKIALRDGPRSALIVNHIHPVNNGLSFEFGMFAAYADGTRPGEGRLSAEVLADIVSCLNDALRLCTNQTAALTDIARVGSLAFSCHVIGEMDENEDTFQLTLHYATNSLTNEPALFSRVLFVPRDSSLREAVRMDRGLDEFPESAEEATEAPPREVLAEAITSAMTEEEHRFLIDALDTTMHAILGCCTAAQNKSDFFRDTKPLLAAHALARADGLRLRYTELHPVYEKVRSLVYPGGEETDQNILTRV